MYWYMLTMWAGDCLEQIVPRELPGTNSVQFFNAIEMIALAQEA